MLRPRLFSYGPLADQVGELWVPSDRPPSTGWPVCVVIHGGFWRAMYGKRLMRGICRDLARHEIAAWNIEYRRLGPRSGGGWPATFTDTAAGIDHLSEIGPDERLDLSHVTLLGHSAGGHLALWAAARRTEPFAEARVRGSAVVALAPVTDLADAAASGVSGGSVERLMGGGPEQWPERYRAASPAALLPLGVPQVVVHGTGDRSVPFRMSERYVERAGTAGDEASLVALDGVGHMALINPRGDDWKRARAHVERLAARR